MLDSIKKLLVFDKKNIIRLIITAALCITGAVLTYEKYSEAFAGFIFFLFLAVFTFKVSSKKLFILDIIFPLYTSLFVLYYFQLGNAIGHTLTRRLPQYWGFLIVDNRLLYEIPVVVFIYFLFRLFRMSPKLAAAFTPAPFMLLSLVNYFVYEARAHEFVFYDIFSVKTAMNVAGNYHFSFKTPIVFYALPYAAFVLSFIHWKLEKTTLKKAIGVPVAAVITVLFGYLAYLGPHLWFEQHTYKEWGDMPTNEAGYYMTFVKSIGVSFVSKPEGYSAEGLNKELDGPVTKLEAERDNTPNIIVIMNESYADLDIYKDRTGCEKNPDPYWDSLKETCVHGWADSSVFAGNTANSEFEFLTGLSMGFLPISSVPYHSYIEDKTYSINWALKDMGYETWLMHPYLRTGWNRLNVYPRLGFDKMMFIDDMFDVTKLKDSEDIDGKITDMAAYEKLIEYIENEKGDNKLFTFMVTIQNHSPYDQHDSEPDVYTTNFSDKVNYSFNTYQTLVNMSDNALKMLTEYLSKQDEEYLVLVFGDHQPDVGITDNDDFVFDGKGWKVPYLIWTNYDYDVASMQPAEDSVTSLNYLGLDVLKIAGFKYNNYYGMIDGIRQEVPCITVGGHKTADGSLFDRDDDMIYDNDADASKALLKKYHWFEYNQLFDENKSVMMKDYKFAQ